MKVQLFGILAEHAGTHIVELDAHSTRGIVKALRQHIAQLDDLSFAIAVDRTIVHKDIALNGSEEIAILPPFSGG